MAAFISNFTDLTTLTCGEMYGVWGPPILAHFLPINNALPVVPPPSSITKLTISHKGSGHPGPILSNILKWFIDLHSGVIDSFSTDDVSTSRSAEFRDLVVRFGPSLSRIELPFLGDNDIGRRGRLTNRSSRLMFSCSQIPGLPTFHHPQPAQACCVQSSASDSELASRRHGTASAKC
jgi:hypothetical protein